MSDTQLSAADFGGMTESQEAAARRKYLALKADQLIDQQVNSQEDEKTLRALERKAHLDLMGVEHPTDGEQTEMRILGDNATITYGQPTTPAPASPATPVGHDRLSTLAKSAIVAAGLLGSGGLGAGAYALLRPDSPAPPPYTDTDTDRVRTIRVPGVTPIPLGR